MKPFNLEEAKAGKPLITRDGRKATFVAHVPAAKACHRVMAFVEGDECALSFNECGAFISSGAADCGLFMAEPEPVRKTLYLNIYEDRLHFTAAEAQAFAIRSCLGCVPVEFIIHEDGTKELVK